MDDSAAKAIAITIAEIVVDSTELELLRQVWQRSIRRMLATIGLQLPPGLDITPSSETLRKLLVSVAPLLSIRYSWAVTNITSRGAGKWRNTGVGTGRGEQRRWIPRSKGYHQRAWYKYFPCACPSLGGPPFTHGFPMNLSSDLMHSLANTPASRRTQSVAIFAAHDLLVLPSGLGLGVTLRTDSTLR